MKRITTPLNDTAEYSDPCCSFLHLEDNDNDDHDSNRSPKANRLSLSSAPYQKQ